jgi:hypothetical protein
MSWKLFSWGALLLVACVCPPAVLIVYLLLEQDKLR